MHNIHPGPFDPYICIYLYIWTYKTLYLRGCKAKSKVGDTLAFVMNKDRSTTKCNVFFYYYIWTENTKSTMWSPIINKHRLPNISKNIFFFAEELNLGGARKFNLLSKPATPGQVERGRWGRIWRRREAWDRRHSGGWGGEVFARSGWWGPSCLSSGGRRGLAGWQPGTKVQDTTCQEHPVSCSWLIDWS